MNLRFSAPGNPQGSCCPGIGTQHQHQEDKSAHWQSTLRLETLWLSEISNVHGGLLLAALLLVLASICLQIGRLLQVLQLARATLLESLQCMCVSRPWNIPRLLQLRVAQGPVAAAGYRKEEGDGGSI